MRLRLEKIIVIRLVASFFGTRCISGAKRATAAHCVDSSGIRVPYKDQKQSLHCVRHWTYSHTQLNSTQLNSTLLIIILQPLLLCCIITLPFYYC